MCQQNALYCPNYHYLNFQERVHYLNFPKIFASTGNLNPSGTHMISWSHSVVTPITVARMIKYHIFSPTKWKRKPFFTFVVM